MEPGDVIENDGWEIYYGEEAEVVPTYEELKETASSMSVMLPTALGGTYSVDVTRFEDYGTYKLIGLAVNGGSGRCDVEIRTDDIFAESPETVRIGRYSVAVFSYDDPMMTGRIIHQGSFLWNGVTYNIWANSEEDLEKIIFAFEETN